MSFIVFTSEAKLAGNNEFGDIEADEGEIMDIQEVSPGPECMYEAILLAANDKGLLSGLNVDEIAEHVNKTTKREQAIAAIKYYHLPACICDQYGTINFHKNFAGEPNALFILERPVVGGFHYDWLKRRGAAAGGSAGGAAVAAGGSAGGASLALRF